MNKTEIIGKINAGELDDTLSLLYGKSQTQVQRIRYIKAVESFVKCHGERENLQIYSAPGRTEIGGNHTDHNYGKVLAGSVNLDILAVVALDKTSFIKLSSDGYEDYCVDISELEKKGDEVGGSQGLIRGIAARFDELGYKIGGFAAYITSNVLKGSGLSSSAAFEVLIGTILSMGYNGGEVSPVEIAQIAQYSENVYFEKPCGLMDQMASSVGGIITIDFADPKNPIIEKVNFDFAKSGFALCILDTGGSHADLTDQYAAIPKEMKEIAAHFGESVLGRLTKEQILERAKELREKFGDRALLRALHFQDDNQRVEQQVQALENQNFKEFQRLVINSGNSSFKYLQNVYTTLEPKEQGLSTALYLAESILRGKGAYRVHGGGFAGTTQNFVPVDMLDSFREQTEAVFGEGSCHVLMIRPRGGMKII